MLNISQHQFDQLGADEQKRFVTGLMKRLRRDFPPETSPLDEKAMRELIDTGTRNAKVYGLISEAHIRFYCGLMLRHGRDFDADPKLPWAGEILDADDLSATEKVARLDEVQVFIERQGK